MVAIRKDDEILDTVVARISVQVMNMLIASKRASEMLFHHIAVFATWHAIDHDLFVCMVRLPGLLETKSSELRQMNCCQATSRTKFRRVGPVGLDVVLSSAISAM